MIIFKRFTILVTALPIAFSNLSVFLDELRRIALNETRKKRELVQTLFIFPFYTRSHVSQNPIWAASNFWKYSLLLLQVNIN